MAKRKQTSRPRDRASERRPARSPAPARPPAGAGLGARLLTQIRRFSFFIVFVVVVGGAIAYGVVKAEDQGTQSSGDQATTATSSAGEFASNRDRVAGLPPDQAFAETCGACHALRAAGSTGAAGPSLDRLALTAAGVRNMIATGSSDTVMPKNLLIGRQADQVARYVARVSRASRRARARAG